MPTVFIVTPDVGRARTLSSMLEHRRYHVLAMGTVELAADVMRCVRPDMLLVDMTQPGTDGSSLLRTLRNERHYTALPVVILEPDGDSAAGERFRRLSEGDVLMAPRCSPEQILQYVKNYLGEPEATADPADPTTAADADDGAGGHIRSGPGDLRDEADATLSDRFPRL